MAINFISGIHKEDNTFTTNKDKVVQKVISFFKKILDERGKRFDEKEMAKLINYKIPLEMTESLVEEVMAKEIKDTIFGMDNNKALGLDGFGAYFFKVAWDIMGKDVVEVI